MSVFQHTVAFSSQCNLEIMLQIDTNDQGVLRIVFAERAERDQVVHANSIYNHVGWLGIVCAQLQEYFLGCRQTFDLPLIWPSKYAVSDFRWRAWQVLSKVPYGQTETYIWQANKMGCPKAQRAVGQANAKNPFVIICPCHRIVAKSSLGGYAGGTEIKEWLLALERIES